MMISIKPGSFEARILEMNQRYDLPVTFRPTLQALGESPSSRLTKLRRILQKELDEIEEIINKAIAWETDNNYAEPEGGKTVPVDELEVLTDIADLMVDLQVYQVSEMRKFGIPLEAVQAIVMDSNESKLDADGWPLKDADGKFLKGPFYWKPEPKIRELLQRLQEEADRQPADQS